MLADISRKCILIVSLLTPLSAGADGSSIEQGKQIAFDRAKGNCLACHLIAEGDSPGNIGPPLVAMQARFPDKKKLHNIIWDITQTRPEAMMPPFGKHKILTEQEIENIVEYIYTL